MRPAAKHFRRVTGLTLILALAVGIHSETAWADPAPAADASATPATPATAAAPAAGAPAAGTPATPASADDASKLVDGFDATLLSAMRDANKLGYEGRYKLLEPSIDKTFNIPLMTAIVVGSKWSGWTDDQKAKVTDAFRRFIIATYARRFDGFSGESFSLGGTRPVFGGMLVMTQIIRPKDAPVTLNYLTRTNESGAPQVVDVFLTGTISELATRRSEFGAVLQRDGYDGLVKALQSKADSQAKP